MQQQTKEETIEDPAVVMLVQETEEEEDPMVEIDLVHPKRGKSHILCSFLYLTLLFGRSRSSSGGRGNRDKKTVFVTQLAQRVRSPELYNFFRGVGRIRGPRVVFDKISRRSKGVGYVEFAE